MYENKVFKILLPFMCAGVLLQLSLLDSISAYYFTALYAIPIIYFFSRQQFIHKSVYIKNLGECILIAFIELQNITQENFEFLEGALIFDLGQSFSHSIRLMSGFASTFSLDISFWGTAVNLYVNIFNKPLIDIITVLFLVIIAESARDINTMIDGVAREDNKRKFCCNFAIIWIIKFFNPQKYTRIFQEIFNSNKGSLLVIAIIALSFFYCNEIPALLAFYFVLLIFGIVRRYVSSNKHKLHIDQVIFILSVIVIELLLLSIWCEAMILLLDKGYHDYIFVPVIVVIFLNGIIYLYLFSFCGDKEVKKEENNKVGNHKEILRYTKYIANSICVVSLLFELTYSIGILTVMDLKNYTVNTHEYSYVLEAIESDQQEMGDAISVMTYAGALMLYNCPEAYFRLDKSKYSVESNALCRAHADGKYWFNAVILIVLPFCAAYVLYKL